MHMDRWIKIGVVAACLGLVPPYWNWIVPVRQPTQQIQTVAGAVHHDQGGIPMMPQWLTVVAPLLGSLSILAAVVIAFWPRRRGTSGLTIYYARYGIGRWRWQYQDVTEELRRLIVADSLDVRLSHEVFGDPFRDKPKHFTVKYSLEGITHTIVRPEGQRLILPPRPYERQDIRIIKGCFGVAPNDRATQIILLNVKVDLPPSKIKSWKLEIQRDREHWCNGWHNPIRLPVYFEVCSISTEFRKCQMLMERLNESDVFSMKPEPIPDVIPGEKDVIAVSPELEAETPSHGWLLFRAENANRFSDLIFGGTFTLTATEDKTETAWTSVPKLAGEWLVHANVRY